MDPIVVTHRMDVNGYRIMTYFNVFRRSKWMPVIIVAFAVLSLLGVLVNALGLVELSNAGIGISAGYLIMFGLLIFSAEAAVKKFLKKDKLTLEIPYTYTFGEKSIEVTNDRDDKKSVFEYRRLYRIFEMKKVLLIYVNMQQGLLIPKAALASEELTRLIALLQEKMGTHYIKCPY